MTAPAPNGSYDELIRRLAVILGVAAIAAVSVWIVAPFLLASSGPAPSRWQPGLCCCVLGVHGGRRWAATTVLTLILAVGFFIPLLMVVGTVVQCGRRRRSGARCLANGLPPHQRGWSPSLVGRRAAAEWRRSPH